MTAAIKFNGKSTLIGSLPVSDSSQALKWIFDYTPDIPLWPQLPTNPLEGMMNQFIEGVPGIIEDDRTYFDLDFDNFEADQLAFYEDYLMAQDDATHLMNSRFSVSETRAKGIYDLKEACLKNSDMYAVKGQITGPFTLLTGLSDKDHKLGYYNPTFRELAVKALTLKGAWQVHFLKSLNVPVLIFIDEPALAGLGSSAFISISKDDIAQDLSEVIAGIKQAGGLAGIHVCANTDWTFMLSLDLDILSFDAYGYFDRLITCKDQLHAFLDRGGTIAWGIIPTSDQDSLRRESTASLVTKWQEQASMLVNDKYDLSSILAQTLITPSCGTGALPAEDAIKVLELTKTVSAELQEKYL